ncbi:MAG: GatB/YqeY domain-containing protein [bacterium]|nr:GatB/YqeY domain-containing protein [bacterium]
MPFFDQIKEDLNKALKGKDALAQSVLRLLIAEIQNKRKEKRYKVFKEGMDEKELEEKTKLDEEEIGTIIFQEAKKRKDSIREFEKGRRDDLVQKEKAELSFLENYLPKQLTEDEIKKQVQEFIKETGEKDFGKVMSALMLKNKGRVDGALLSQVVRSELSGN